MKSRGTPGKFYVMHGHHRSTYYPRIGAVIRHKSTKKKTWEFAYIHGFFFICFKSNQHPYVYVVHTAFRLTNDSRHALFPSPNPCFSALSRRSCLSAPAFWALRRFCLLWPQTLERRRQHIYDLS